MIISVKKKTLIVCFAFICCTVLACFLVPMTNDIGVAKLGKTIVIDAGHGGSDGGVSGSVSKIAESDVNLAVAKSLKNYFERSGYTVVMTRKGRDGLYSVGAKNKKRSDMQARRDIINNATPDLVISIHQNFYPLESVKGAQVFYSDESENAIEIADDVQRALNSRVGNDRQIKSGDYYILKCTPYPSIIVECGFLSNPSEEKLLVSAPYQQKVAYAIFSAVHASLGKKEHDHE